MADSCKYVFSYFPIYGRGYAARCLLALSGAEWKNEFPKWPEQKFEFPFHRLPVLTEIDENGSKFVLSESHVIERYLATKYGRIPSTGPKDVATCDMYFDQINESLQNCSNSIMDLENEALKEKLLKGIDFLLTMHEKILNSHNGTFYFGDKILLPDISMLFLYNFTKQFDRHQGFDKSKFPKIMNLIHAVATDKRIAAVQNDK
ncbi:Glutathione S-transferase P 1 [Smittium mucronatum]|uniref:Glutathione S-transferase P 1 n=1 Tax=Smittium mucronatum TaxID=133383 RepID=A0A1R0H2C3_9FUNG|nr:Glutathione S-transferase P 1 [Smittium mucronatum]